MTRRGSNASGADHGEEGASVMSTGDLEAMTLLDRAVEGGPLDQGPFKGSHEFFKIVPGHQLTVFGPCGPGDVLVHQGSAQVVDPRPE